LKQWEIQGVVTSVGDDIFCKGRKDGKP